MYLSKFSLNTCVSNIQFAVHPIRRTITPKPKYSFGKTHWMGFYLCHFWSHMLNSCIGFGFLYFCSFSEVTSSVSLFFTNLGFIAAWKDLMLYLQLISSMSIDGALLWSHQCSELTGRAKKGQTAQYWFASNIGSFSTLPSI